MSDKQKKILEALNNLILSLSEREQERLLAFGEGVAFMANQRTKSEQAQRPSM